MDLRFDADEAWAVHGVDAPELVALGFIRPEDRVSEGAVPIDWYGPAGDGEADVRWYVLTNEHAKPNGSFTINAGQLEAVIADAMERGMIDWERVLWHSHPVSAGASQFDIEAFPAWLVAVGLVYHAESGTTTVYDQRGEISSLATNSIHTQTTG